MCRTHSTIRVSGIPRQCWRLKPRARAAKRALWPLYFTDKWGSSCSWDVVPLFAPLSCLLSLEAAGELSWCWCTMEPLLPGWLGQTSGPKMYSQVAAPLHTKTCLPWLGGVWGEITQLSQCG